MEAVQFLNFTDMGVSIKGGTPKSSTLMGFSHINHPAIGAPPFMETPTWPWLVVLAGDFYGIISRYIMIYLDSTTFC